MKILVISFYYQPDLCAGSFRTTAFINALRDRISPGDSIDVITTLPNRYGSYRVETPELETDGNVTIRRIRVPFHRSGFFDQTRSFIVYFINALRFANRHQYDVVFATSSRLFSAFLAAIISKWKRIPLYLDIRDIFTDTLESVLKGSVIKYAIPAFVFVEKFTMRNAGNINLVSKGFAPYFARKYKNNYTFFSNGIDDEFQSDCSNATTHLSNEKIVFTYTGNIGEGQGLEKIIPAIAERYKNIEFVVIGDGGRKNILKERVAHLTNVKLIPPVTRSELTKFYKKSDVLFLQLNNYEAFKKVLPSKIFEYAAMFKPIIAGVDGYAKEFLQENVPDSMIFRPCNIDDFCRKYEVFDRKVNIEDRKRFIAMFSRKNIMNNMAADFLEFTRKKHFVSREGV